ncbi:MAG: flavin reductase family protein [Actinomycetota bacterium]|nr:flavin reductase family protein [Actinomycetota bacterium]
MTIHDEHPFLPPEGERDPLRRLRGRMPAPVTVWATGAGADRVGLTVSSVLVAAGDPDVVLGLLDEDSAFWDESPEVFTVSVLGAGTGYLADALAGTVPAPGGPFTLGTWQQTAWGPVVEDAAGWLGVRRLAGEPRRAGWAVVVEGVVEHVEVGDVDPMLHVRGRYRDLGH